MSDENTTIDSGVNGRTIYSVVVSAGKTYIINAVTGRTEFVVNGEFTPGGDSAVATSLTTAERTAITPDAGVLIWDTDLEKLFVGDGSTAGGVEIEGGGASYDFNSSEFDVQGSTVALKTVPQNKIAADRPVFSNFAATLAANTALVAVDYCNNRKNDVIEFYCEFDSFGTLTLSHGTVYYESYPVQIDGTNITILDPVHSTTAATYAHGLTLSSFVRVTITKANTGYMASDITVETLGGSYTARNTSAYGCSDAVQAIATFACTNAKLDYVVSDAMNDVWVCGDSYTGFIFDSWASLFTRAGHNHVLFSGRYGSGASDAVLSLNNLLTVATPRYLVWAIGMNDPDTTNTVNATWLSVTQQVLATCDAKGITPILVIVPNTPTYLNVPKNNWIKASGRRYINFAQALNAETAGATWYTGMLSDDNLHPTPWGYEVLSRQFTIEFPESVQDDNNPLYPGYHMQIEGYTVSMARYMPIEVIPNTATSATLCAGHAYKITATSYYGFTLNTETIPSGQFGMEGHAEIFLGAENYIHAGSNVVLVDPLTADAVNDCTLRFHDGTMYVSVEDHVAGYLVTVNAASGAGSLPYALSSDSNPYVSFDVGLDGETISLAGTTTYAGEKHVVGNGYNETTISGGITCTHGKTTFSNLSMLDVAVNGGTMTLGDVNIPSGSTVAVTGASNTTGLIIQKVVGKGVLDFGGTTYIVNAKDNIVISGCSSKNGGSYGCYLNYGGITMRDAWTNARIANYGKLTIAGSNTLAFVTKGTSDTTIIESGASIALTNYISGTAIQVVGGTCTVNGHVIVSGTYTSIASNGTTIPAQPA